LNSILSPSGLRLLYRAWRYRLALDKMEIGAVRRLLRPGDTAVDIGAHKGAYSYWIAKSVGPRGTVYAFEPQPILANPLRATMTSIGLTQVTVQPLAVSAQAGVLPLTVPGDGPSPGAKLGQPDAQGPGRRIDVNVVALDHFFEANPGRPIRFIKCDTEGHEGAVFQGAADILRKDRPLILVECEARHGAAPSIRAVWDGLEALGYHGCFPLHGRWCPLHKFDPAQHQTVGQAPYINNFLFGAADAPEMEQLLAP
jgi:FkbM family methyltransferase